MNENNTNNRIDKLTVDELTFYRINPTSQINLSNLADCDGLILNYVDEGTVLRFMTKLRRWSERKIYLKPVFLYKISGESSRLLERITDGTVSNLQNLEPIADVTRRIHSRLDI